MTKVLYFDKIYNNITVEYQQFWRVLGHWFKFLDLKMDSCNEHEGLCPTKVGKANAFTMKSVHPKLNKLTPYGMYRSRQYYFDASDGMKQIGCVDMMVPYEK